MSLSHLLKSANRLGLSIIHNQQGRISSAVSYRTSRVHHHNSKLSAEIFGNKGSSSWLSILLHGRPYNQQQSCSDDALHVASVCLIMFPLLASTIMLTELSRLAYIHEVVFPIFDRRNLQKDGKFVYSNSEVLYDISFFERSFPLQTPGSGLPDFIDKILSKVLN